MTDIYHCSKEEFLKNVRMPTRIMETETAMYEEMADIMVDTIRNNGDGQTVIICPVGPIGQYQIFAEKVNKLRLSLKNCRFINMDEYLTGEDKPIAYDDPLSFHATMDRMLYSRIDDELIMPENQRIFPEPGKAKELDDMIAGFGKVDLCLTGVGINGHIAFNEPPCEDITDEEFGSIGTRCLDISKETIVNNGANKIRGALDIFPRRCISLGMKQLLSAKKFKVYLYCPWQWGIMRKISLSPVTRTAPASYLQDHPDAEMVVTAALADFTL
ncbi:MAG: glucosamine-6-phosphate isomerase [Firmicutes bacterium]|nr:glucosamine-6-phosphate isomerase [Candidatus Colimorpha enterica]